MQAHRGQRFHGTWLTRSTTCHRAVRLVRLLDFTTEPPGPLMHLVVGCARRLWVALLAAVGIGAAPALPPVLRAPALAVGPSPSFHAQCIGNCCRKLQGGTSQHTEHRCNCAPAHLVSCTEGSLLPLLFLSRGEQLVRQEQQQHDGEYGHQEGGGADAPPATGPGGGLWEASLKQGPN